MKLPKTYNAKRFEKKIYKRWETSGFFSPKMGGSKKPFTIMMPPPNATGTLHLGHAVMLALEDIMIRYHRMKGECALWIPGTDHASIATQNKVEKLIAAEGLSRHSLGRKAFLKRVDTFVKQSQNTIRTQIRRMGSSCDWTRERYTLEPQLNKAVREIFVRMYNDGLIYRGHRIVNWCPRCASTLADDEVSYKEERTQFYYLKYGPFVIGTVRPETKFLDKVIVVNPQDKRYKKWVGKSLTVPWIEGEVQATILADKSADMSFGSGAMTITPAHDFTDFEIAKHHKLDISQIIDEKGNLNSNAGEFAGMNARAARKKIIEKLQEKGLVEKIEENYVHNVALCYRCDTPIEPLVSKQWFIDVDKPFGKRKKSLKKLAIDAVRKSEITIVPDRFNKTYFQWMENLHDWCISRQIWFGHQIPVWYCSGDEKKGGACKLECKEPFVQVQAPKKCPHCGSKNLAQDPDTLDTWFSSGLWTFSTLGWPNKTKDLDFFHPTSVLETGYDILFFWIARMIIMTEYALGEVPFKYVYLHGLVRTREGKKMSKSHPETCIDPLDMIDTYGADSLRLSMVIGSSPGNDIRLYEEKIAGFRNFVNKIWNAARFALGQQSTINHQQSTNKIVPKTLADKWILTRTQKIIKEVTDDIEQFRFSEAGTKIYDFTWNEYCAWYLEISKGDLKNFAILRYVLETILKLLHPFVPYITEVLWQLLGKKNLIMGESWPIFNKKYIFPQEVKGMNIIIKTISNIRTMRQENNIEANRKIAAICVSKTHGHLLEEKREPIMRLACLGELEISQTENTIHPSLRTYFDGTEIILPVADLIDVQKERGRIEQELERTIEYHDNLEKKLANKNYTQKAPQDIVAANKKRLAESKERIEKLAAQVKNLL